jgi:transposase
LVKLVAMECDIELELDRKGNLKNIKAMASRRTFLEDRTHRIRFVYTPKHTSWLNQIELWFSILARKLIKRGSFASVEELHQRILEFIEYFNRTMAKPLKWTYQGRPLKV